MYNMTRKVASQLFIIPYTAACKCLILYKRTQVVTETRILSDTGQFLIITSGIRFCQEKLYQSVSCKRMLRGTPLCDFNEATQGILKCKPLGL